MELGQNRCQSPSFNFAKRWFFRLMSAHPFGTQKQQWNITHTLLKGKEKVSGEFALIFLCYIFRRILMILKDKT
jgi:hypothetical protein